MKPGSDFAIVAGTDPRSLDRAVALLLEGGVIAYPTETFYGLGCLAEADAAVERIFRIKGREGDKPLPLIVADQEAAYEVAGTGDPGSAALYADLARAFWPGPLTLLLEAKRFFPPGIAPQAKIALRVSAHPVARALARGLERPLVATSANRSGRPPAVLAAQVAEGLARDLPDLILRQDPCPGGESSTILDLTAVPPRILRAGAVPERKLEPFLKGRG